MFATRQPSTVHCGGSMIRDLIEQLAASLEIPGPDKDFRRAYAEHRSQSIATGLSDEAAHEIGLFAAYLCGKARAGLRPQGEAPPSEAAELQALDGFVKTLALKEARAEREHLAALIRYDAEADADCGICFSLRKMLAGLRGGEAPKEREHE